MKAGQSFSAVAQETIQQTRELLTFALLNPDLVNPFLSKSPTTLFAQLFVGSIRSRYLGKKGRGSSARYVVPRDRTRPRSEIMMRNNLVPRQLKGPG